MRTILVVAMMALAASAFALEDTPENRAKEAERYLKAAPPADIFKDAADQMTRDLDAKKRQTLQDVIAKQVDLDELTKTMKESLVKHFTAGELKGLADFYNSPEGKSAMGKFGAYMADVMPAIQGQMMKVQAELQKQMSESAEKK
jgi:hypothetical protein